MEAFLEQVARHYFAKGDISDRCFVFPNRRAMVFFKKYLGAEAARAGRVSLAPQMLSINDFFFRAAGSRQSDRVQLLLDLYTCYKTVCKNPEPLDEFVFWGDMILADFSDVDKYLVDAKDIFANIAQFKEMQDFSSYLSEGQKAAIERFVQNFSIRGEGSIKQAFQRIWDLLYPLYTAFNEYLTASGRAYEGMVYRRLAERLENESAADIFPSRFEGCSSFVFVGLNTLCEAEKKVLRRLRNAHLAEFCWDYSSSLIKAPDGRASLFLSENVAEFPQAFEPDGGTITSVPEIHVMSVPSGIGQAKQLPKILDELGAKGLETAIVLPDETLLGGVLNSIPERFAQVNVTMGYPMGGSQIWSLLHDLSLVQMQMRVRESGTYVYHRHVQSIFSNPVFKAALTEAEKEITERITADAKYYIPVEDFGTEGLPALIFKKLDTVPEIGANQMEVIRVIASRIKSIPGMMLELDFAKHYYAAVERLSSLSLDIQPKTYYRLLGSLLSRSTVPFHGEPLSGLQIMGPLETRSLDFDNLVILSCNEGVFPRHSVGESFIPATLRQGFGLPTYELQDAMWAYYFYRSIQRASKVWLLYDSRTEMSRSGEESRFIKQLEMHFGLKLVHHSFNAPAGGGSLPLPIEKTDEDIQAIRNATLSASSLQSYLSCPAKFYYHVVKHLKESEELNDSLDTGAIGRVLHSTMETLYKRPGGRIDRAYLQSLLSDRARIHGVVEEEIRKELRSIEVSGRNLVYLDIIERYASKIVSRDLEKLGNLGLDFFTVESLEQCKFLEIGGFKFVGILDRLDSFVPGVLRVVDYKTGKVLDTDLEIDESNAAAVVDALFGTDDAKRPKIALQLYLYDCIAEKHFARGRKRIVNSIYQTARVFKEIPPEVELCDTFRTLMSSRLQTLLEEIADPGVPFRRTENEKVCQWCDFKTICGR